MPLAKAKPSPPLRTIQELAELVGRDVGTVSRYTKRDDWPFRRRAPWARKDVPAILRWCAETLQINGGGPAKEKPDEGPVDPDSVANLRKQKLQQEVRKLFANADQAETALARERGQLLEAAAVEREWASTGAVVRNAMTNLPDQLQALAMSHGMPGEAAAAFRSQAEEMIAAVLRHLSRDGSENDN